MVLWRRGSRRTFRKEKNNQMKTIAFSILNWNGVDDTIDCVSSLLASDYEAIHMYLLDNWSRSAEEYTQLKNMFGMHKKVTLNRASSNLWFTWWNNYNLQLMKEKKYDYVCLLNNDCLVGSEFLSTFLSTIDTIGKAWIYGPVISNPDGSIQSCWSFINLRTGTNPRLKHISWAYQEVDCVSGSCFIISWQVVENVWLLDERYFAYREESDYCKRAAALGYPIISVDIPGIIHKEETATNKKKPYYTYLMFRNRILFLKKHANMLQYVCSWIILFAYITLYFPKTFWYRNFPYLFKGIQDGIQGKWWPMK